MSSLVRLCLMRAVVHCKKPRQSSGCSLTHRACLKTLRDFKHKTVLVSPLIVRNWPLYELPRIFFPLSSMISFLTSWFEWIKQFGIIQIKGFLQYKWHKTCNKQIELWKQPQQNAFMYELTISCTHIPRRLKIICFFFLFGGKFPLYSAEQTWDCLWVIKKSIIKIK